MQDAQSWWARISAAFRWPGACLAALALLSPALATAQDQAAAVASAARVQSNSAVRIKLVMQQGAASGPFAAWTKDDQFVAVYVGLSSAVQVWSVKTGNLINVIPLPAIDPKELLDVRQVVLSADNRFTITANLRATDMAFCTPITLSVPIDKSSAWSVVRGEPGGPCLPGGDPDADIPSHNGKWVYAPKYPAAIYDHNDEALLWLGKPEPETTFGAALSPDGKRFALLSDKSPDASTRRSTISIFDLTTTTIVKQIELVGYYAKLKWLDNERIFVPGTVPDGRPNPPRIPSTPSRVLAVDGTSDQLFPLRCYTTALPDGSFVGAGTGNCTYQGAKGQGLERYDRTKGWRPFGSADFTGLLIDDLQVAPDGQTLAVIASGDATATILAIDARTGAELARAGLPGNSPYTAMSFTPDSKAVGLRADLVNYRWDLTARPPVPLAETDLPATRMARETANPDGSEWYERFTDIASGPIAAVRIVDGKREARMLFDEVMDEGVIPDSDLRWVVTGKDGLVLWQPRRRGIFGDPEVLRTYLFPAGKSLSLTPEGRYDTSLGADAEQVRWMVSDAPLQSLAPSTFMRDFFEPRLMPRLIECHRTRSCDTAFRPVGNLAELNRALPQVTIKKISRGADPGEALVDVEVRAGKLPGAPNGKTASLGYDLRLFREGHLVDQWPRERDSIGDRDLAHWRKDSLIVPDPDGVARHRFTVGVPSGQDVIEFTAYAFNEDRVKSETAWEGYSGRPPVKRTSRVFVIALGVDNYSEPRLQLHFAAGDAQLIGQRLGTLPGGRETRVLVVADDGRPGSPRLTKQATADIFAILGGAPRAPLLARLAAQGIDAAMLDRAGPDDTVLISFSGHGWTDPQGGFYLLPADASWADETGPPDIRTIVSSGDMARQLRQIDAGELALIIDACHSAASVNSGGFRAGPMGDAGLGQLAFDKKMRILTATQSDALAMESAKLGQGLLTYALANEGITADGGLADANGDKQITLDEWLRYAARRLPALSRDPALARLATDGSGARGVVFLTPNDRARKVQEPALFDFTGAASTLVLRELPK